MGNLYLRLSPARKTGTDSRAEGADYLSELPAILTIEQALAQNSLCVRPIILKQGI